MRYETDVTNQKNKFLLGVGRQKMDFDETGLYKGFGENVEASEIPGRNLRNDAVDRSR